ncbi:DUF1801 domain-containing protein [Lacinutrix iliipiscaria]|uniref:DUF1801 domain-containing protein n=1 Tax=Lacinutrix iliipiscaria TaxID=1230532 RepID=A0ABW5WQA0_9FLAO
MATTDNFYLNQEEPNRSCLLLLRDLILNQDQDTSETRKYSMPCFCYKNKMFCYLWIDKKSHEPYILFVEGKHLNHSELEVGSRKRMKTLRINPNEDVPITKITNLINEALDLYRNGIIKTK